LLPSFAQRSQSCWLGSVEIENEENEEGVGEVGAEAEGAEE